MPKVSPLQSNFGGGEFSPLLYGRVDAERYRTGLKTLFNAVPMLQGGLLTRPPTTFVKEVKDSTKTTRLVRFEFSTTQAYILEFGDLYFRVYKDHGNVESAPTVPVEIVTPYVAADLSRLKFTQSADVLYVTHPSYAPRKISRTSHTSWTVTVIDFQDGPYLSTNTTTTTLTLSSAVPGAGITVTASANLFAATDVGRLIRFQSGGSKWGWMKVTGFTDATHVTVTLVTAPNAAAATTTWRLGLWSDTTLYPGAVTFFEDRLVFGGSSAAPQRVDGSNTGDYENFAPSDPATGTIGASNAIAYSLNANDVNIIQWLVDDEKGLICGTPGGVWVMRPSSQSEALTPTNVRATRPVSKGASSVQPAKIGGATVYVQRAGRKVFEFLYTYEVDGFRTQNLTEIAEHITLGGITDFAYQQEPLGVLWALRADGTLLGLTYDRDVESLRAGWHRHVLGGVFGTGQAVVESIACIPGPSGDRDELWMVVKRTINGSTKRYVEYMNSFFMDDSVAQADAAFLDCSLSYSGPSVMAVSGLSHLEGQTVSVLADGGTHPDVVVSGGTITLSRAATKVYAGLNYFSDVEMLRIEAGAADGTALGKTRRIHRVSLMFYRTGGIKFGRSFDQMEPIAFRRASDPTNTAPPLFSGIKSQTFEGDYDTEQNVCIRRYLPVPMVLLAVAPQMETQDRG